MKIYTYYKDINASSQNELIDLWKISWSRQGYEPIVLNLEDAKKHPYFEVLNTEMHRIFNEITGRVICDYGMSCWLRWLAYATQSDEKFYVSDYDAININFPITEPNDKLHLMDCACPFFASGTPTQFENLCKSFVEISNERIEILKQQANHYHDQNFFTHNFMSTLNDSAEDLINQHNILMTRNRLQIGGMLDPVENKILAGPNIGYVEIANYGVIHLSHDNIGFLQKKYRKYKNCDLSKLRIDLFKGVLNIQQNKFIDYLKPHRSVGGGVINAKTQEFTDTGLKTALIGSSIIFNSLGNLLNLSKFSLPIIENLDTTAELNEIGRIFNIHRSDKSGPNHRYDLVYQDIFTELRSRKLINILEIGIGTNNTDIMSNMGRNGSPGASLYSYRDFFPEANIFGADIDERILFNSERIQTAYVDQLKPETFNQMHIDLGKPSLDLFIEDGLHSVAASLNSLNYAISVTKKNGYIILEDLHNPQQIWQNLCLLLDSFFQFQSVKLVNSGGLMLIIKV
jgi:hypothetical protein